MSTIQTPGCFGNAMRERSEQFEMEMLQAKLISMEKERDDWKAKAEANERDAERYRYLRDKEDGDMFMENVGSDLDRAIDAARSAEKEK